LIPRSVSHHRPGVRDDQPFQYDTNDWFSIKNVSLLLRSLAVISLRIPWVKAAQELGVDCIVLWSHENSLTQKIQRVVAGSTSRQVLQHAPCPIMVVPPRTSLPRDLVTWYEEAVTRYLHEQAGRLTILTPSEVAHTFGPAHTTAGRKEVAAATRALERLASNGVLCCRPVNGELRCMND
jgi:hypothetical protein